MIIEHLGPFHDDGSPKLSYARVCVKCDHCKQKQWNVSWYTRRKREHDCCQSCKNVLGIAGMKGKKHSDKVKKALSERNSGDFNPSKRSDVRAKLSKKLKGRKVPWLTGKKRPEHSKFMSEWMAWVWANDCTQRDAYMAHLKETREKLQRGHSKLHDQVKTSLCDNGIFGFESEQVLGRLFVDELHKEKKVVLEVLGDFWHANPKRFQADELMTFPGRTVLAKEVWARDAKRRELINRAGYHVVEIWESDWRANSASQIEKIKEALNG